MPRLGCKLDVASGDTGASRGNLGTFNPLFFKSATSNDASILRPSNLMGRTPVPSVSPRQGFVVTMASDVIWRYSTRDGVYDPGGNIELPPAAAQITWERQPRRPSPTSFNRHVSWTASYVHLFGGEYVDRSGGGDVDYFGTWVTLFSNPRLGAALHFWCIYGSKQVARIHVLLRSGLALCMASDPDRDCGLPCSPRMHRQSNP